VRAPHGFGAQRAAVVLPAIAVLLVALCFGEGMQATDDLDYADAAISLLGGAVLAAIKPHHHEARLSVILPLAAIFSLAGTSDASIALLPLAWPVLTFALCAATGIFTSGDRRGSGAFLAGALLPAPERGAGLLRRIRVRWIYVPGDASCVSGMRASTSKSPAAATAASKRNAAALPNASAV
jgi:hypothetical protein